ncbi:MAG: hypothetical protein ACYCYF_01315 [Anaerolineae bacterium]
MDTRRRVLLVGDTLVLAGLEASLRACDSLEVVTVGEIACREALVGAGASVVVYDRTLTGLEQLVAALQGDPDLVLIGVDPSSDGLLVTASREQHAPGVEDLLEIIAGTGTVR